MKNLKLHLISFNIYPFKNNSLYLIAESLKRTMVNCLIKEFDFYENNNKDFSMDSFLEVYQYIKDNKPEVIGLSEYVWTRNLIDKTIKLIKKEIPDSIIFLGGPSFKSRKYTLNRMKQNKNINYIVRSDGEYVVPNLVNAINNKIDINYVPNIAYRVNNGIFLSENEHDGKKLNTLINKDLLNNKIYLMETYRGCYQKCKYCVWSATNKKIKDITYIKEELNAIIKSKVPQCFFSDPHFGYSKEISIKILEYISKNNICTKFGGFINLDYIDDEYCKLLKNTNFNVANIGIQTLSKHSKNKSRRKTSLNKINNAIEKLKRYNVDYRSLDVIYGLPGDNFESFKKTIDIAYKIGKQRLFIHSLMVLPGSEFYENPEHYGLKFVQEPPWNVLENNTYSFKDIIKSKKLHIGQEIIARMFPISFDFIINLFNKKASNYMLELGNELIKKKIVSLDIDLFDWIRKIKGYDDGFRKKILDFMLNKIKISKNRIGYQKLKEMLVYESFNYPLYYYNIRYNNNYSFINEKTTLSATFFSKDMLYFAESYKFDYPVHTVKDYKELLNLKKAKYKIDTQKYLIERNFETPIKT